MALSTKLEMRQSQSLVMTPQLMQAIKLLQLSSLDLQAYVAEELERNPLLERANSEGDGPAETSEAPDLAAADGPARAGDWLESSLPESRSDIEGRLDTDLGNVFPDERPTQGDTYAASQWSGAGSAGGGEGEFGVEDFATAELSLADHLEGQLVLAVSDPRRRLIGSAIIDAIDEAGYLGEPLADIAARLGASLAETEAVLAIIHGFDPPGVGARSVEECLSLQLKERDRFDPAMQALVANLDRLARRDLPGLKRLCGVDDEDLADMIAELRRLTPKPGLAFGSGTVQPVVPDVLVRPASDGGWHVELNPETLPRVLVNQTYYSRVSRSAKSAEEKTFIAECLQTANWLSRSLEQRARTILKVASEIVRQQDAFLVHGVAHLRPLNLRAVADAIGMHESTVSRVTSNKYVATPRGIFELKYFFTTAISSSEGGDAHSAEAVRHHIKTMIDGETADEVLSDDAIVLKLKEMGIDIARRTVAKYREAMGIGSSVQRRREKAAGL